MSRQATSVEDSRHIYLRIELEGDRYLLPAARVLEVVPVTGLFKVANTPSYVAGVLNYHGQFLPVFDLCDLTCDRAAKRKLSTRIVIVRDPRDPVSGRLMGLKAERVTDTEVHFDSEFESPGFALPMTPYLGDVVLEQQGMVRKLILECLIGAELLDSLFAMCATEEAGAAAAAEESAGG